MIQSRDARRNGREKEVAGEAEERDEKRGNKKCIRLYSKILQIFQQCRFAVIIVHKKEQLSNFLRIQTNYTIIDCLNEGNS